MTKRATPGAVRSAGKRRQGGPGRPLQPGNPWRFKPGESGNPSGKPAAVGIAYGAWLAIVGADGRTNAMRIAEEVGRLAIGGDLTAVAELREATEGKVVQPVGIAEPGLGDARERLAALLTRYAVNTAAGEGTT